MTEPVITPSDEKRRSNPRQRYPVVINIGDSLAVNLYKKVVINCNAEQGMKFIPGLHALQYPLMYFS